MPEICRFRGIVIFMYFGDHEPPHFHVRYQGFNSSISINQLVIESGELPPKILRLVQEWAKYHQDELKENWELCKNDQLPKSIKPL